MFDGYQHQPRRKFVNLMNPRIIAKQYITKPEPKPKIEYCVEWDGGYNAWVDEDEIISLRLIKEFEEDLKSEMERIRQELREKKKATLIVPQPPSPIVKKKIRENSLSMELEAFTEENEGSPIIEEKKVEKLVQDQKIISPVQKSIKQIPNNFEKKFIKKKQELETKSTPENINTLYIDGDDVLLSSSHLRELMSNDKKNEPVKQWIHLILGYLKRDKLKHLDIVLILKESNLSNTKDSFIKVENKLITKYVEHLMKNNSFNKKNILFITSNPTLLKKLNDQNVDHWSSRKGLEFIISSLLNKTLNSSVTYEKWLKIDVDKFIEQKMKKKKEAKIIESSIKKKVILDDDDEMIKISDLEYHIPHDFHSFDVIDPEKQTKEQKMKIIFNSFGVEFKIKSKNQGNFTLTFGNKKDALKVIKELEDYPYGIKPLDKDGFFIRERNPKRKRVEDENKSQKKHKSKNSIESLVREIEIPRKSSQENNEKNEDFGTWNQSPDPSDIIQNEDFGNWGSNLIQTNKEEKEPLGNWAKQKVELSTEQSQLKTVNKNIIESTVENTNVIKKDCSVKNDKAKEGDVMNDSEADFGNWGKNKDDFPVLEKEKPVRRSFSRNYKKNSSRSLRVEKQSEKEIWHEDIPITSISLLTDKNEQNNEKETVAQHVTKEKTSEEFSDEMNEISFNDNEKTAEKQPKVPEKQYESVSVSDKTQSKISHSENPFNQKTDQYRNRRDPKYHLSQKSNEYHKRKDTNNFSKGKNQQYFNARKSYRYDVKHDGGSSLEKWDHPRLRQNNFSKESRRDFKPHNDQIGIFHSTTINLETSSKKIKISGIPASLDTDELSEIFEHVFEVDSVRIDRKHNEGYISFHNSKDAKKAIEKFNV
eukprot:gene6621-10787_t